MKRHPDALVSRRNYRDTRLYLRYCEEVRQAAPGSLLLYRTALDHLLRWATNRPFSHAPDVRPVFPLYLAEMALSTSYQGKTLEIARQFFEWARERYPDTYPSHSYLETLRPVNDQPCVVTETRLCTLDVALKMVQVPPRSLVEERSAAAAAMLFLSGARAAAFVSLPLEAVILDRYELRQWPKLGVRTKGNKAGTTYLLQSSEVSPLLDVVRRWDAKVRRALSLKAPWYALIDRTGEMFADNQMPGKSRTRNLARYLQRLCRQAGIDYYSPHTFRHGFTVYALGLCETMDDFKAVSQNLMHETMATTDAIYSRLLSRQVAERMAALGSRGTMPLDDPRIRKLAQELFRLVER